MKPEDQARIEIDRQLRQCGWVVQDHGQMNISAATGVVVREFPLVEGRTDYLLYAGGKAIGVVEAKPEGHSLSGVEPVLAEICGKSKPEVKLIAAAYDARGAAPDRTRPVIVPKAAVRSCGMSPGNAEALPTAGTVADRLRGEVSAPAQEPTPPLRSEVTTASQDHAPLTSQRSGWPAAGVRAKMEDRSSCVQRAQGQTRLV